MEIHPGDEEFNNLDWFCVPKRIPNGAPCFDWKSKGLVLEGWPSKMSFGHLGARFFLIQFQVN